MVKGRGIDYCCSVCCIHLHGLWQRPEQFGSILKESESERRRRYREQIPGDLSFVQLFSRGFENESFCIPLVYSDELVWQHTHPCKRFFLHLLLCLNMLCRPSQLRHNKEVKHVSKSNEIPHRAFSAFHQGCERSGRRSGRLTRALPFLRTYATMPADMASGSRTCCSRALPIEPSTLPCTESADLLFRLNLTHYFE